MDQAPKQERSRKRIEVILTTAENILLENTSNLDLNRIHFYDLASEVAT